MNMRIILGSQSPRRKEILSYFSVSFEQATPPFDEETIPFEGDPTTYVTTLSKGKANSLLPRFPREIIVTADTIVYRNGKIYEKPRNKEEAFHSMIELSGNWHTVFTGITVKKGDVAFHGVEETRVLFNDMNPDQISLYHKQLHCEDKAGGYAIQHAGAIAIKKIDGCFYNVMGLPINTLKNLLMHMEIDLWKHLRMP